MISAETALQTMRKVVQRTALIAARTHLEVMSGAVRESGSLGQEEHLKQLALKQPLAIKWLAGSAREDRTIGPEVVQHWFSHITQVNKSTAEAAELTAKAVQAYGSVRDVAVAGQQQQIAKNLLVRVPHDKIVSILSRHGFPTKEAIERGSPDAATADDIAQIRGKTLLLERLRKSKATQENLRAASGFLWTKERLDYVAQAPKQVTDGELAEKLNEKTALPYLPHFALLPAMLVTTNDRNLTDLRKIFAKKEVRRTEQTQYIFARLLHSLAEYSPESSEPVLRRLTDILLPLSGSEIKEARKPMAATAALLDFKDPATMANLQRALEDDTMNTHEELHDFAKSEALRIVADKLDLTPELRQEHGVTDDHLIEWLGSRTYNAIVALAAGYKQSGGSPGSRRSESVRSMELLSEIALHVIKGREDFLRWRYENPLAEKQLEGLSDEQKQAWRERTETKAGLGASSREDFFNQKKQATLTALKEAIGHSRGIIPGGKSEALTLEKSFGDLERNFNENPSEENRLEVDKLRNRLDLIRTINSLREIDFASGNGSGLEPAKRLRDSMEEGFRQLGLHESVDDLYRLKQVLAADWKEGQSGEFTASDEDESHVLLEIGEYPVKSCQSFLTGSMNYCLPAYVADANKKAFVLRDSSGNLVARSMGKLIDAEVEEKQRKLLFIEKTYSANVNPQVEAAVLEHALNKAIATGTALAGTAHGQLEELAGKRGMRVVRKTITVTAPPSHNEYEYSDAFGGVKPARYGYTQTQEISVILPKARRGK